MDASAVTVAHNLIAGFKPRGSDSGGVEPFALTKRMCGATTCAIRDWTVSANLILADKNSPWARMHIQEHGSRGEELVGNSTLSHNLVRGQNPTFGAGKMVNGTEPANLHFVENVRVTDGFQV
eukprot:gene7918-428_t